VFSTPIRGKDLVAAKKVLTAILTESLAERGFRRRGDSWHRLGPDLYSVVHLQPSRWDSSFYLNLGFAPAGRVVRGWLPESKCLVRFRVEAIKKLSPGDLRLLNGDAFSHMGEPEWRVGPGGGEGCQPNRRNTRPRYGSFWVKACAPGPNFGARNGACGNEEDS